MARYGMLIDTKQCIGCMACVVSCRRQNGLEPSESFIKYEEVERGIYPNIVVETIPLQCMHCEDAPCVSVCPTGASYIGAGGIVEVDHGKCIGCQYCMAACPYQVRVQNPVTGNVDKCRFCTISATENGTKMCSCVEVCPTGARVFGDLDDPDSELSRRIAATNAQPIAGDLTKSKVFYVR